MLCCVVMCVVLRCVVFFPILAFAPYFKYRRTSHHFFLIVLFILIAFKLQVKDCVTVHFVSDYHQVYEIAFPPMETPEPTATIAPMFIDQTASLPFLSMENGVK